MQALLFSELTRRNLCMHMLIKADEQNLKKKRNDKIIATTMLFLLPFLSKTFSSLDFTGKDNAR